MPGRNAKVSGGAATGTAAATGGAATGAAAATAGALAEQPQAERPQVERLLVGDLAAQAVADGSSLFDDGRRTLRTAVGDRREAR